MADAASILSSVKKTLGLADEYDVFDMDVVMHINSVFADLQQLGIGPPEGFEIVDATETWEMFTAGIPTLNSVKSYVYLRVRLLFDPPGTSYLITAMNEQIQKAEWRLNVQREGVAWVPPGPVLEEDVEVVDGGVIL